MKETKKKQAKASSKKPVKKRVKLSAKKPVKKRVKLSAKKPVKKRVKLSAKKPVKKRVKLSAKKPVKKRVKLSAKKPVKKRVKLSAKKPVKKQAKASSKKSVKKRAKPAGVAEKPAKKHSGFGKKFQFIMKDVRCFAGEQALEIRPLTFLTGENSTGKTTVLGCLHTLTERPGFISMNTFNFNEEPYQMGSFDTIARKTAEKKEGRFELGLTCEDPEIKYRVCFIRDPHAKPTASYIKIILKNITVEFNLRNEKLTYHIISKTNKKIELKGSFHKSEPFYRFPLSFFSLPFVAQEIAVRKSRPDTKQTGLLMEFEESLHKIRRTFFPRLIDVAPVRSKPERYYPSFMRKNYDPEGGNIPTILMDLSVQRKERWENLCKELVNFGKTSGLFNNIEIKKTGQSAGSPFEIQFKVKGVRSNMMDVGYGVSQVLPILAHLFLSSQDSRLLLQQPEVHLHPKAQAALASLFIESVKTMNKSFLIETHSDYMVDRACIEIRKGNIPPDYVSLIYLESLKDGSVRAHNISFDKEGNMKNVPPGYRDFFLKETDEFLGVKD